MAGVFDWTTTTAEEEEAIRQSVMRQKLRRVEVEYDQAVQKKRDELESELRGMTPFDAPLPGFYRQLPPEDRARVAREEGMFSPANPSPGYTKFLEETVRYPGELLSRPRDTGIRAAQEFAQGNALGGFGYAASALPSMLIPALAAGRPGDPDDWREQALSNNVPLASIMAIDYGTDPMTYTGLSLGAKVPRAVGALGRAANNLRYGRGARTELVDPSGAVIRRLLNSPSVSPLRPGLQYVP